jgi:hypothetical protein
MHTKNASSSCLTVLAAASLCFIVYVVSVPFTSCIAMRASGGVNVPDWALSYGVLYELLQNESVLGPVLSAYWDWSWRIIEQD